MLDRSVSHAMDYHQLLHRSQVGNEFVTRRAGYLTSMNDQESLC